MVWSAHSAKRFQQDDADRKGMSYAHVEIHCMNSVRHGWSPWRFDSGEFTPSPRRIACLGHRPGEEIAYVFS